MKPFTSYDKYMELVKKAKADGYMESEIMAELANEKKRIDAVCQMKMVELSRDRNPYPRREAKRYADECKAVIDRILSELDKKEITA